MKSPPPKATQDPRWISIVTRDKAADDTFWYSVATTGIFCRPSCPSRLANPKNVRPHESAAAAEAAGFRACHRCNPGGMSIFKKATGLTPKAYAVAGHSARLREGLTKAAPVTEAFHGAGYGSNGRYYEASVGVLGMSPTQYRFGGAQEVLTFAVGQCSLGAILVASSAKGIAAILLGDDPEILVSELENRFPLARLVGGDPAYEQLVAQVVGLVEAPANGLDLPLDVRGTAFQQRVWIALREIPAGQTSSYRAIAEKIGSPRFVRAVAGACAANALAVAIPCHRVVRNDGKLSGYRWGVDRKRELIARESTGRTSRGRACSVRRADLTGEAVSLRLVHIDATALENDLEAQGWAVLPDLLTSPQCHCIASMYGEDDGFRSRVVMARHGFGQGEYRYFSYPLPSLINELRTVLYPRLVPVANRWHERMGMTTRFPASHDEFIARCTADGQTRPTPLLLQYGAGDYNCLHQDLYGEHVFPLQVAVLHSEPRSDFSGGEFVLTEQRPRMQTRVAVVPLTKGDAVVFAVNSRPVHGTRGDYRVKLRHGVSKIVKGHRHTLGIIFHDAT